MATFRKRLNKWQVRIQRVDGPHVTKSFHNIADAKIWARKIEREYDQGHYDSHNSQMLLCDAITKYEIEISPHKKRYQIEIYRLRAWKKQEFSKLPLHKIRTQHLALWRNQMVDNGFKANTIRLHLAVLSHLFNIARIEWGFEHLKNPVLNLTKPKCIPKRVHRISDKDISLLITNTESTFLPSLIKFALYTGMRRSEIIKLTWGNINWDKNIIEVNDTKNGEDRNIPMFESLRILLQVLHPNKNGQIFPITEHAVSVAFRRAVKRSKLDKISFHTLRHEAISRFFEQGFTIPEVAMISGHKSWSMLKRYTHLKTIMKINNKL
jgi:integrase